MRLGAYYAVLEPGTKVAEAYGEPVVSERHRHRYEFNSNYRARLEAAGFVCCGRVARPAAGRVHRARRPPLLGRHAGPSGVQEPPRPSAPAVPRSRRRRPHAPRRARAERRSGAGTRRCRRTAAGFRHLEDRLVHQGLVWDVVRRPTSRVPTASRSSATSCARPGAVGVVPLLVRRRRRQPDRGAGARSTGRRTTGCIVEIPAGMCDVEGEPPEETARRELAEEVGLAAGSPRPAVRALPVARG